MVEIIPVAPEANVEAVRRRMAQGRSEQVALALPEGWTELDNVARLRLLQRQAQIQQRQLALITRHEATRRAAQQLGIPVFGATREAQQLRWRMNPDTPMIDPRRPAAGLPEPPPWRREEAVTRAARPSRRQARRRRISAEQAAARPLPGWLRYLGYTAMGSLLALVLAFFAFNVLPAATITLTPGREPFSVTVTLTADGNLDTITPGSNVLAARFIETTLEQTDSIATTGTMQKASNRAVGQVVFNNLGAAPVNIPTGTVVGTSTGVPVSFRTTAPANLDGGVGARVTVPVEAINPGIEGNVRANTINTVSGALRFRVRVNNPTPTGGGGAQLVQVVTQQDRTNLLERVQAELEAQAYQALQSQLEPGEWLPPESVRSFIVSQVFDKFNDDEGNELSLTLRILAQGTALNQERTNQAMLAALGAAVPERGRLVADSVAVRREPGAEAIGRRIQFTMTGFAEYVIPIDPDEVSRAVAGLPPERAVSVIMTRWPLARPPEIYRDPEWLDTLPTFPNRIQVRVEYAGSLAAR